MQKKRRKMLHICDGSNGSPNNYRKIAELSYHKYGTYKKMAQVLNEILEEYFSRKRKK